MDSAKVAWRLAFLRRVLTLTCSLCRTKTNKQKTVDKFYHVGCRHDPRAAEVGANVCIVCQLYDWKQRQAAQLATTGQHQKFAFQVDKQQQLQAYRSHYNRTKYLLPGARAILTFRTCQVGTHSTRCVAMVQRDHHDG